MAKEYQQFWVPSLTVSTMYRPLSPLSSYQRLNTDTRPYLILSEYKNNVYVCTHAHNMQHKIEAMINYEISIIKTSCSAKRKSKYPVKNEDLRR